MNHPPSFLMMEAIAMQEEPLTWNNNLESRYAQSSIAA
jgi:hypothetical protein